MTQSTLDPRALLETMRHRRSSRTGFLEGKPVTDEQITLLLEAARASPSGGNAQPWEFIVIRNRDMRNKIVDLAKVPAFRDSNVGPVVDEHGSLVRNVARESPHARQPRERKAIEPSRLERAEKLLHSRGILNAVHVVAADGVRDHDLRG